MPGFAPNMAQKLAWASTTTGTPGTAYFQPGRQYAYVQLKSTGSTGTLVWKAQGSNSTCGVWFDLTAATTSTGSVSKGSTVTGCFDRVRVNISANNTTSVAVSAGIAFWVSAR